MKLFQCLCSSIIKKSKMSNQLIESLKLVKHPKESGYFSGTTLYDSKKVFRKTPEMTLGNIVQFLYEEGDFSPWHRMLISDEIWVHQAGGAMNVHMISPDLEYSKHQLQPNSTFTIPSEHWYASEVQSGFCLYAEILIPGFHEENCEFGTEDLIKRAKGLNDDKERQRLLTFIRKSVT